ncbi:MAG: hypothetical protein V3S94_07930 [Gammaproteobacteria bacterium]
MTANQPFEDLTNAYLDLRGQFDPVQATAAGRSEFDQIQCSGTEACP